MNIPKLEYTVADAKAIGAKLQASGYRVDYLLNEEATRKNILQMLNGLRTRSKNAKGIVFVGLFGHGTEIEATSISYYCPYDAKLVSVLNAQGGKATGKQENDPDTGDTFAGHGAFSKCFLEAMSRHSQMGSIIQEVNPAVAALVNTTKSESDPSQTPRAFLFDIVDLRLKIEIQSTIPPPTAKKETSESLITNSIGMRLKSNT